MSTVVGIAGSGRIVMAADRLVAVNNVIANPELKLWRTPNLAVGIAGDLQDLDTLAAALGQSCSDLLMLRCAVAEFRRTLETLGRLIPNTAENGSCRARSHFLIATPYGLFHLEAEFGLRPITTYWAIGSGREYALGVLAYVSALMESYPSALETYAEEAIEIAAKFDPWTGCGVDVAVVDLTKETDDAEITEGQR